MTSYHPVKLSSNRPRGSKDIMKFICHVNSRNYVIEGICSFVVGHMTPNLSHPSVKFNSNMSRESELITFFICHVTLYDHVINRLSDFMDNRPTLEPLTLSSLVAIGPEEAQLMVVLYYKPPLCQFWQS